MVVVKFGCKRCEPSPDIGRKEVQSLWKVTLLVSCHHVIMSSSIRDTMYLLACYLVIILPLRPHPPATITPPSGPFAASTNLSTSSAYTRW